LWREENQRIRRKTLGAMRELTTNSTHISRRNRTRVTLVGDERSHHVLRRPCSPLPFSLGKERDRVACPKGKGLKYTTIMCLNLAVPDLLWSCRWNFSSLLDVQTMMLTRFVIRYISSV